MGVSPEISTAEEKKVRLLNGIDLAWLCMLVMFVMVELVNIINTYPEVPAKPITLLVTHLTTFIPVLAIFLFQYYRLYHYARIGFIVALLFMTYLFSYVLNPGVQIEYFFMFIAPVSVVFFENWRIKYGTLFVSMLVFFISKAILNPDQPIGDGLSVKIALFVSIFVLVNYLKKLNTQMEKLLETQRNKALEDAQVIREKNDALTELQDLQNQSFINLAHEIRTPLTIIKGYRDILPPNKTRKHEESEKPLASIAKQILKIDQIVEDILGLSKIDENNFSLHLSSMNISELLQKLYLDFKHSFNKKEIEFFFEDHTSGKLNVLVDPVTIERAFSNLLSNALKYTPAYESVYLRLIADEDPYIKIQVQDSGVGVKPENQDRIFKRYFQEANDINQAGGNGIGLSYAQQIIEMHNGKIELNSVLGSGSVFSISLKTDPLEFTPDAKEEMSSLPLSKKETGFDQKELESTILLVEDDEDMRGFIKTILDNYSVIDAEDGLEGLAKLHDHEIDFIITDYMMPQMNGLEFVKEVKRTGSTCPIMVLTARSGYAEKYDMLQMGVDDYLIKPFESAELRLRVRNSLKNSRRRRDYSEKEKQSNDPNQTDSFFVRLRHYIEENCADRNFSILDVCDVFAMSQSSLYRKIKSKTGLTIKEFITEVRLQKARRLIEKNPAIGIKAVALEIGLSNSTYFKRIYENRFGALKLLEL